MRCNVRRPLPIGSALAASAEPGSAGTAPRSPASTQKPLYSVEPVAHDLPYAALELASTLHPQAAQHSKPSIDARRIRFCRDCALTMSGLREVHGPRERCGSALRTLRS